jgi:phospholipid-binding lipoprotein MlaA
LIDKVTAPSLALVLMLAGAPADLPPDTVPPAPAVAEAAQPAAVPPVEAPAPTPPADTPPVATPVAEPLPPATAQTVANSTDIVVTAKSPADPLESVNVQTYEVVQAVDDAVIAPVARAYKRGLSDDVRDGIRNAINNIDEPIVFVNFLLQLKIGKAFETAGRFAINSTVGVAGIMDVAKKKPFNLPRRSNGLADTLGYYGVGPGPYLFLPLIGPTTVRDMTGRLVDLSLVPAVAGKPFNTPYYALPKGALSALDERARNDEEITERKETADPYVTIREHYLKKRQWEIAVLRGEVPDPYKPANKAEPEKPADGREVVPAP